MTTLTPYLYFKGECASALAFYAARGLGEVRLLRTYAGTPMAERHGEAWRDRVLHALVEGPGVRFFASDGPDSEPMKGCALYLEFGDPARAAALFAGLSEGGRVTVPFALQSWGEHYGNFTDRFGVQWAMGCRPPA
jgi:PhnB protein